MLPAAFRRFGYRVAARLLYAYWFVRRPTVRGVRCALWRDGEVLLVRHTYGDRRWALPGGLMRGGEEPKTTARREMREELGFDIASWRVVGDITFVGPERANHVVACVAAPAPPGEPALNAAEIDQMAWFAPDALPDDMLDNTSEIVELAGPEAGAQTATGSPAGESETAGSAT